MGHDMTTPPNHEWTADHRVPSLLDQLRSKPEQKVWSDIPSRTSWRAKERVWDYTGPVATALKAIRDEYGQRCIDYADADWDNRKQVATAWNRTKTVEQVIDDAMASSRVAA